MKRIWWPLLLITVTGGLWFVLKDAPRDQALDTHVWRQDVTSVTGLQNPRRNMVKAVQQWIRTAQPSEKVVWATLGAPDGAKTSGDSWMVGCFTNYFACIDGQDLVIEYRNGLAASSRFTDY